MTWIACGACGQKVTGDVKHNCPKETIELSKRIAELEKIAENYVGYDCREMRYIQEIENKDVRISKLEKDLHMLQRHYDQLEHDLPSDEHYECYTNDAGDTWCDCPDDIIFVERKRIGDMFELECGWKAEKRTFRVTKAPDDESDDYEVEMIEETKMTMIGNGDISHEVKDFQDESQPTTKADSVEASEPVGRFYWESIADSYVMAIPSEGTSHYNKDDFPLFTRPSKLLTDEKIREIAQATKRYQGIYDGYGNGIGQKMVLDEIAFANAVLEAAR